MATTTLHRVLALGSVVTGMTETQLANTVGCSRERIRQLVPRMTHKPINTHKNYAGYREKDRWDFLRALRPDMRRELFWARVSDGQSSDACWEWPGPRLPQGYGLVRGGGCQYAHRVAWEYVHGPIPEGMCICHKCDNPPCCNPAHLFLGTRWDNIQDAIAKGRWRGGRRHISDATHRRGRYGKVLLATNH
jgi:hypothetical protein